MSTRDFQFYTRRAHPEPEIQTAFAVALGVDAFAVGVNPELGPLPDVRVLVEEGPGRDYAQSMFAVVVRSGIAPLLTKDVDVGVQLAQSLGDYLACDPTGVPGAEMNEDLWAVIDPQGVVRLAREVDTGDDDDFKLDIDPTPIPL